MQEHTFTNHTQVNSSSTPPSISPHTQRPNTSAPPIQDTSGNLGYGIGRLLRGAFDLALDAWQSWWHPGPSAAEIAHQRQVMIYRQGLEECVKHLDSAMDNLRKNPKDPQSLKRIETLVSHYAAYVQPASTDALKRYQQNLFQSIGEKMRKLPSIDLKRRLSELLPIVSLKEGVLTDTKKMLEELNDQPLEATSMTDTSDSRLDIESALGAKGKRFVPAQPDPAQPASEFPPSFNLSTLDGSNGFSVSGLNPGDYLGSGVSMVDDINGDGKTDLVLTAYGVSNLEGAAYVIYGQPRFPASFNLSTLNGTNGFVVTNKGGLSPILGTQISRAGDINGDGKADLVIGGGSNRGPEMTFVIYGQDNFPASFDFNTLNGTNGFVVSKSCTPECIITLSPNKAGDINGDGKPDLVLGDVQASNHAGAAYVIYGQSHFPASFNLSTLDGTNGFVVNGISSGDNLGQSVCTGDINGDGKTDLVLGAPLVSNGTGAVYVIYGQSRFPAAFNLTTLNGTNGFVVNGISTRGRLGSSATIADDINGDGKTDLVLGANFARNNVGDIVGAVYVIYGQSRFPAAFNLSTLNGHNGFVVEGLSPNHPLGWWRLISDVGDVNGDGKTDLVLAAAGGLNGTVYVIYGQSHFPAAFNLSTLNGHNGFVVTELWAWGQVGPQSSTAGDINGDGKTDLMLGASGNFNLAGAAYVIYGVGANSKATGAIIGGTVGGLLGLVGLLGLGYLLNRRFLSTETEQPLLVNNDNLPPASGAPKYQGTFFNQKVPETVETPQVNTAGYTYSNV